MLDTVSAFVKAFLHLLAGEGGWGRGRHLSLLPQQPCRTPLVVLFVLKEHHRCASKGVLEQSIAAKMNHVYDNVLGWLKIRLHESALTRAHQAPTGSKSKLVFLSHAAKDQAIAIRLKQVIENAIVGSDVFVSSDTEDLHPGDEWVGKIQEKPREAKMLIILATDRSLNRPWVLV